MTINLADNTPRVSYAVAQGATQTSFTVSFEFFDAADLNVYVDGTLKTITTHYTVSGGDGSTGTVTMSVTGATGGSTVVITRDIDLKRTTDFPASGSFQIGSLNTELDKLVAIAADLDDKASRALQLTDFDTAVSLVLPDVNTRKGKTLAFNASTGAVEAGPSTSDVQTVSATAADIAALADIEDGTTATDAISGLAAIKANVTTVAGISSNVTTVAGISSNVTAVAGDASDIGTVASNISSVNTNATNISAIQGAAANASTATTKASEAASSATAAAASATTATTQASTATTQATTSTTKAGEAATSATASATSATASATSATASASSATAAAASQTAAASSAAAAASSFDSFDDRYLGPKSSNPSQDNDGNALVSGALYFNSTANEMRVYDGANWIAATSAGNVSLILYEYTATSNQTTFSGSDDNSATLSYTADNLQVVMNGVILDPSDYTASNGTSVVLASGAATNDLINIYAFKSFTTADMVSKTNGGTFAGAVTVPQLNADNIRIDGNTISSTDTNGNISLSPNGTGDTIIASGNVGIGTNSVASGGSNTTNFNVHTPAATSVYLKLSNSSTGNSASDGLDLSQDSSGNAYFINRENGFSSFWTNATERMRINSSGNVSLNGLSNGTLAISGGNTADGSKIQAFNNAGNGNGYLAIEGFDKEYMRIDSSGNVGIGTSPTAPLHVKAGNGTIKLHEGAAADNKYGMLEVSNGKLILHSDAANVENQSTMQFHLDNIEYARFKDNGQFAIGSDGSFRSSEKLTVKNSTDTSAMWCTAASGSVNMLSMYRGSGQTFVGSVETTGSATQYVSASDHRLKENVVDLNGAIDRLKTLSPRRFNFIAEPDTTLDGFIAHEVTAVPEAVSGTHNAVDDDGNPKYQGLDASKLVPLLTGALQEAIAKIETLETKVAALEAGS